MKKINQLFYCSYVTLNNCHKHRKIIVIIVIKANVLFFKAVVATLQ